MNKTVHEWFPLGSGVFILLLAVALAEHHPEWFFVCAGVLVFVNACVVVQGTIAEKRQKAARRPTFEELWRNYSRDAEGDRDR